MQKPTLSKTHIAFAYAGDLWLVAREGGEARLLTSGTGTKSDPVFSPHGSMIAFSGDYDGNVDVYVMPSEGGVPRRLTHHPAVPHMRELARYLAYGAIALLVAARFFFRGKPDPTPPIPRD
jgi:tricorn protease-like protein